MTPREVRAEAMRMQRALTRMARADERTIRQLTTEAGVSVRTFDTMGQNVTRLSTVIAMADAVGYEVVLRRRSSS